MYSEVERETGEVGVGSDNHERRAQKRQHPMSLIQCGPSSQFVFELVSRDCLPPPPPTTLIPHIEVGFKGMWTLLATQKKKGARRRWSLRWACRASSSSNSSRSLWILLVSCPTLKLEELSSRDAPSKATNRGQSTVSSSIFPTLNIVTTKSNLAVEVLDEAVSNFFFELSLNEKFELWKIPIGNHIHLNLTSMCSFSLNPPPSTSPVSPLTSRSGH